MADPRSDARGCPQPRLCGIAVAVTRPEAQARSLTRCIEASGGKVIIFPALAIAEISNDAPALAVIDGLAGFDMAIFVSANAVRHGLRLVRSRSAWPVQIRVIAVGPGTAEALLDAGLSVHEQPQERFDTHGLLCLPALRAESVTGRRIAIFRGRGGLESLRGALVERGAAVEYAEVYERRKPDVDATEFVRLGERGEIDIVVVSSGDALRNLFEMVGDAGREWLCDAQLLVASERVAELGTTLGLRRRPTIAHGASDARILDALSSWHERKGKAT